MTPLLKSDSSPGRGSATSLASSHCPSCTHADPGGNLFPVKAIGAARATEWEGGGSLPPS